MEENPSPFYLQENIEYPGTANSYAYMSGKARYKDHDEEKAKLLEEKYSSREKENRFSCIECSDCAGNQRNYKTVESNFGEGEQQLG